LRDGAGQFLHRAKLLADDDRRRPLGNRQQPLHRLAVLEQVEHGGAPHSLRNLELPRLHRIARTENSRHCAIGLGAPRYRARLDQFAGDLGEARAFFDDDRVRAIVRTRTCPQQPVSARAGKQREQRGDEEQATKHL